MSECEVTFSTLLLAGLIAGILAFGVVALGAWLARRELFPPE